MNRRGFLGLLSGAAAAGIVGVDLAELLAPTKTYFLPPRAAAGSFFIPQLWAEEFMRYCKNDLILADLVNQRYRDLEIYGTSVIDVRFTGTQFKHTRVQPTDLYMPSIPCQGGATTAELSAH